MTDDAKKLITLSQLKTVVNQLLRIGKDAVVKTLKLSRTESTNAGDGTILSEDENHRVLISYEESGETVTRTVATCEDYTQSITAGVVVANTLAPGCFASSDGIIPTGYSDMFYLLPNASFPSGRSMADPNYGGRILTSRNRSYDVVVINRGTTQTEVEELVLSFGAYYQISGTKFRLLFPNITSVTTSTQEYWILLSIPSSVSAESVSISFDNQYIRWASGTPDWSGYIGRTVQIHIIGNVATITAYLFEPIISQASLTSGSYTDAVAYASLSANVDRAFQWLLDDYENGVRVTKPIWHLGGGYFVDAEGAVVNGNIEITPSSPSSGHTTPGEIVNPDPVNVD